jgi:hypothetical protein
VSDDVCTTLRREVKPPALTDEDGRNVNAGIVDLLGSGSVFYCSETTHVDGISKFAD